MSCDPCPESYERHDLDPAHRGPDRLDLLVHAQDIERGARRAVERAQVAYADAQRARRLRAWQHITLAFVVLCLIGPTTWLLATYGPFLFGTGLLAAIFVPMLWFLSGPARRQALEREHPDLAAMEQRNMERRRARRLARRRRGTAAHVAHMRAAMLEAVEVYEDALIALNRAESGMELRDIAPLAGIAEWEQRLREVNG